MKSMKRASLWGTVKNILIILIITIAIICVTLTVASNEPEADNALPNEDIAQTEEINEEDTQSTTLTTRQTVNTTIPQVEETSSTYTYNITTEDRETLARLVFLEANGESLDCQKAVVSVVINRMHSGYWGNTINSVIYAKNQFTPAAQIPYTTPTATNYEAVDYVLADGATIPSYVLYFRAGYHFNWNGYVPYMALDNTYFGYMLKDKK